MYTSFGGTVWWLCIVIMKCNLSLALALAQDYPAVLYHAHTVSFFKIDAKIWNAFVCGVARN